MPGQDRGKYLVKRLWLSGLMALLIGLASCNQSLMPNMGVTDTDARNIASYLYTLR